MHSPFRRFGLLAIALGLLQALVPLLHAHVGGDSGAPGFHIHISSAAPSVTAAQGKTTLESPLVSITNLPNAGGESVGVATGSVAGPRVAPSGIASALASRAPDLRRHNAALPTVAFQRPFPHAPPLARLC